MRWFRLYSEVRDDPKLLQLSDWEFRQFIYLLCAAADEEKEGLILTDIRTLARQNRGRTPALRRAIDKLKKLHVINDNGNGIEIINWKKRQYQSDTSRIRTRKWREKQQNVTSLKRHGDGPEAETEREADKPPHNPPLLFDSFWKNYPKKKNKQSAKKAWKKIKHPKETLDLILKALEWQKGSHDWLKENGQFIPYPASYLNAGGWDDEPGKEKENDWGRRLRGSD